MSRPRQSGKPENPALRIEREALWALEHPEEMAPREAVEGRQRLLRLWSYPARGTPKAWTLFLAAGEGLDDQRPLVREVAWSKQSDTRRSSSPLRKLKRHPRPWPGPTLQVRDAEAFLADLRPFLVWAGRAGFQGSPPPDVTADGDAQGIEGFGPLTHLRIEWRGQASPDLEEPVYWIDRLRRLLESAVGERGQAE